MFCCLKRASQKLVPSRNFSHLEPQKFVPANHKRNRHPQNKSPAQFSCCTLFWWILIKKNWSYCSPFRRIEDKKEVNFFLFWLFWQIWVQKGVNVLLDLDFFVILRNLRPERSELIAKLLGIFTNLRRGIEGVTLFLDFWLFWRMWDQNGMNLLLDLQPFSRF